MSKYRVGFIGAGRPWQSEGATGFGMAYQHADGFAASPDCELVAVADPVAANAEAFAGKFCIGQTYPDYPQMLAEAKLDIVSVCTWPALHAPMVVAAAEAGVKAIHCEKPIAPTLAESRQMVEVCAEKGVQLTFNHQRRFEFPYTRARKLVQEGAIGELKRLEMACGNFFDWGTHWFDMMLFYVDQSAPKYVLAQLEKTGGHTIFGITMEGQGICLTEFENGVKGILVAGDNPGWGAMNRLVGTEGMIETHATGWDTLRIWNKGRTFWEELTDEKPEMHAVGLAALDVVESLKTGREPELSARKAMMATEMVFGCYLSHEQGRRIDLPASDADCRFLVELSSQA